MNTWNTPAWCAGDWRGWLCNHGSLTRRLVAVCPRLRVLRLAQGISRPNPDEYAALGLRRGQHALIREVLLICDQTPLVFAHSVIPLPGLHGPWVALSRLGHRPLGETLFANPSIHRFPLEYRRLDARHPLYRPATAHLDGKPQQLWMRRSQFALAGHPLLVTEVFLPALSVYPLPAARLLNSARATGRAGRL